MAVFSGRVRVAETSEAIPGLVVSVLRRDERTEQVVLAGTAITDARGGFRIVDSQTEAQTVLAGLSVTGPADAGGDRQAPLFSTPVQPLDANAATSLVIRIPLATLEEADLVPPSTGARKLGNRVEKTGREAAASEEAVGDALSTRVTDDRKHAELFSKEFLPKFMGDAIVSDGASLGDYRYVVGANDTAQPLSVARRAIADGIQRIQDERGVRAAPAPGQKPAARRRTRFFFSDQQLAALDAETADAGNPRTFTEIAEDDLFDILGLSGRVAGDGLPSELAREDELFAEFLTGTRGENCASDALAPPAETPPPPPPDPPSPLQEATREDILAQVRATIEDIQAPRATLTGSEGQTTGLAQSIRDFAVPVGPADEPRIFDFSSLEVAFDDVWQTVTDQRLEPLARALYTKTNRVLRNRAFAASELQSYAGIRTALAASRRAVGSAAPGVLMRAKPLPGGPGIDLESGLDFVLPEPDLPLPPPPEPEEPDRPDFGTDLEIDPSFGMVLDDNGDELDVDAEPEDLAEQIDRILREPHSFTAFGADDRSKAINFGLSIGYRHVMTPVTYQVGDLLKTITLAPNESREYSSKIVSTRKRSEKELLKNSSIRQDEFSETSRAETEIIRKAAAKTNFALNTEGTYNLALSKGKAKTNSSRDGETNSNDVKKSFREAVRKASEELRQERTIDLSFETEESFEATEKGRIENSNSELTLTYLFFELQRRFRVNETIQKATPVVLIAQDVPSPDKITNAFLVEHAWVLRRALLDDAFEAPLEYVQGQIVGDRLEVISKKATLASHRAQVRQLRTQLVALEEQAGRRYEALLQAVRDRLAEEGREESDGFLSDLGESLFGGGQQTGTARLREEAARDAEQRAAEKAKDMAVQLQRGVNALNEATEAFDRANNHYNKMSVKVAQLRLHVKRNIIYYMQAIWAHEVEDQRFLRLYRQPVPQFVRQDGQATVYRRVGEAAGVTRVHVLEEGGGVAAETRTAVDFELVPSIEVLPEAFDRPLVEVADLTQLLGFFGNYMIFPMKQSNALTDMMLNPYVDEGLRLLDPDDPGNVTRPQFAEYICRLRERLSDAEFEDIREALSARYRELLLSSEYSGDEIVVPSGALYMEALPGTTPLLESFKLAHRAFDLVGAQEDARTKALENLRLAARLVEGDLDDPETDTRYDFFGAPGVVAPTPPEGGGGDGS